MNKFTKIHVKCILGIMGLKKGLWVLILIKKLFLVVTMGEVVVERMRAPNSSSAVSVWQSVGSNSSCVLEQDT